MLPVCVGLLLMAIACVLGIGAVVLSPIIVWPAAVGGLLPFSFHATEWLEIISLPGCFILGVMAFGAGELGSELLEG
jgi:hypothetical protein